MRKIGYSTTFAVFGLILVVVLFVTVSYLSQHYAATITDYLQGGFLSMCIYIAVLVVTVIFAPIELLFLIPLASALWGWVIAGTLTLIGWSLGSAIVYYISRRYGVQLIGRFVNLSRLHRFERLLPQKHIFITIVLLRLLLPLDLMSYVIGLFTRVRFIPFMVATVIGYAPLAYFLSYAGTFNVFNQLVLLFVVVVTFVIILMVLRGRLRPIFMGDERRNV